METAQRRLEGQGRVPRVLQQYRAVVRGALWCAALAIVWSMWLLPALCVGRALGSRARAWDSQAIAGYGVAAVARAKASPTPRTRARGRRARAHRHAAACAWEVG